VAAHTGSWPANLRTTLYQAPTGTSPLATRSPNCLFLDAIRDGRPIAPTLELRMLQSLRCRGGTATEVPSRGSASRTWRRSRLLQMLERAAQFQGFSQSAREWHARCSKSSRCRRRGLRLGQSLLPATRIFWLPPGAHQSLVLALPCDYLTSARAEACFLVDLIEARLSILPIAQHTRVVCRAMGSLILCPRSDLRRRVRECPRR
jgi:hypothetical protein